VKREIPAPEEPAPVPAPAAAVKPAEQPAVPARPSAPQQAKQSAPPATPDAPQAKQAEASSQPAAEPLKKSAEPAPAPAKAAETAAAAPAPAPAKSPAQPAKTVEAPAISFGSMPAEESGGKSKLIWILAGAAALVAIFVLLVYPGFLMRRGRPEAPVAKVDMAALALRAERNAGQLILTWNREAEVVKTARKAMLAISDGTQRENVDIDLAQLQNGSIVYTPVTADVSFRLEVTGPEGKPQSEYVRVLGNRPSAMPTDANPVPGAAVQSASNAKQPAAGNAAQQVESAQAPEPADEPAPAPATPRPSLAERLRPAKPSELKELALAEPPKLEQRQPAAGVSFGLGQTANVPPPVSAPARPSSPASQQQLAVGGRVREATLVKRVEPAYPMLARQARVRGTVQLHATVGRDGRVRDVKVVTGHPLLRQAAVDAVKQWIYTPSLLNGAPVEVVTKIEVGFSFQGN
jgi:protein TonB